jgi:transcriptional regulator GlxA family with amidase domain
MKHVSILALENSLGSSITIPLEMLSAANDIARARKQKHKMNQIEILGVEATALQLSGGLGIRCSHQYAQGATICSITTGSYFLAEAGLLNGRPATTHWRFFDHFQKRYPAIKLQRKRFITGTDRLYCTGSVNAARDLMLHFIELLYDKAITSEVSRHFTHELKRSYESLLLSQDPQRIHHDELIIKVQEWLQLNFQAPVEVIQVAAQFGISVRSLNRRFKQATNTTPLHYLQEIRIEQAKELLKQSNLVVSEVADQVGYHDVSHFCEIFKKNTAVTPNAYRNLVRNKLFLAEGSPAI